MFGIPALVDVGSKGNCIGLRDVRIVSEEISVVPFGFGAGDDMSDLAEFKVLGQATAVVSIQDICRATSISTTVE